MLLTSQRTSSSLTTSTNLLPGFIFTKGYCPNKLKEGCGYEEDLKDYLRSMDEEDWKIKLIERHSPKEDEPSGNHGNNNGWKSRFLIWTIFYELETFYLSEELAKEIAEERFNEFYVTAENAFCEALDLLGNELQPTFMRHAFSMIRISIRALLEESSHMELFR